jgi:hypothetical protein
VYGGGAILSELGSVAGAAGFSAAAFSDAVLPVLGGDPDAFVVLVPGVAVVAMDGDVFFFAAGERRSGLPPIPLQATVS